MASPHENQPSTNFTRETPASATFFTVGIGASAGGLESLEKFFANVPDDSKMAFIIIQHLSPDFKSMMNELLARHTKLPIHAAEDGMVVEAGNVYLLPPKKEMIISQGRLHLADKDLTQGLTLPIDHFFRSLAQDCGQHAIAVVLSGTGSDGSRGITDVHRAGGLVVSEDESTAQFDGMPLAAQLTGVVDLVLQSQQIPAAISDHAKSPHEARLRPMAVNAPPLEGVEAVFDLLRREYDIDFSHYKPTTVSRRIERRLALVQVEDLDEYVEILRESPAELNSLYMDLLIGVTKFFRDADPFQRLERDIIPRILERVPEGQEIRVWTAGCATGEEPYSLAILFDEALKKAGREPLFKIFATDVHKTSLDHAGAAIYDKDRLKEVSDDRKAAYFTQKDGGYQVSAELRRSIVFAQHNVIKDPPFTNLDLITCRNLLIYFLPPAQKKAISLFHFGLKTGGVMLLGSSESPGELADEFETIDEHSKLYRKRRDIRLPAEMQLPLARRSHGLRSADLVIPRTEQVSADRRLLKTYDALLDRFMPPGLLINDSRELIESFGGAEKFLRVRARRPSSDLLELLRTDARTAIAGALNRVRRHGQPLSFSGVELQAEGETKTYKLTIEPIRAETGSLPNYLILLELLESVRQSSHHSSDVVDADEMSQDQLSHLESELRYTKENLQATIEELETSNEEMQATNEELVASNEELQSTNEELHSVNEELYTVNAEHQKKITEMAELNEDIEHLLQSSDVATVFLDDELRIRKFTPAIAKLFALIDSDIGRHIGTFSHRIEHKNLVGALQEVLEDGQAREVEVCDIDGRYHFMRLLPYVIGKNVEGVLLTLVDITAVREAHGTISRLSAIVESSDDAIIGQDLNGVIHTWNHGAERLYGYSEAEAVEQSITLLIPEDQLEQALSWSDRLRRGERIDPVEVNRQTKAGNIVCVSLSTSPIRNSDNEVVGVSSIARDVTPLRASQQETREADARIRLLLDSTAEAIYGLDNRGECVFANKSCVDLLGYESDEDLLGKNMHDLIHHSLPDGTPVPMEECQIFGAFRERELVHDEQFLWRKDGTGFPVELWSHPMVEESGTVGAVVTFVDITERKETASQLRDEVNRRERFLAMLSHELRNPLSAVRTATRLLTSPSIDAETDRQTRTVIDRQTAHMTRLLDDLLDISRVTQNKIQLNRIPIDMRSAIHEAVESVATLANSRDLTLNVQLPDVPLAVEADPGRLQQILTNLLTNAVKYSNHGSMVKVFAVREDGEVVAKIIDEGSGIDPDLLSSVFDIFIQSDTTLDRSQGGMGVGLTLVRELVELHAGKVSAKSEGLGRGSEFEVRLPASLSGMKSENTANGQSMAPRAVQTVVIVEDQDDNREVLAGLLRMEGFAVHSAANGADGLKLIDEIQPDAAVVDIGLPGIDGYEVARSLSNESGNKRKPLLIALTGYGQAQDVARAFEAGFDHHLVKPLQPDRLLAVLRPMSSELAESRRD